MKQPVLSRRIAKNMRRAIEKCSLVERFDEGERKPVFGLTRQSDLDLILVADHCRSMDHLALPRLRGDYPGGTGAAPALDDSRKVLGDTLAPSSISRDTHDGHIPAVGQDGWSALDGCRAATARRTTARMADVAALRTSDAG